MQALHVRIHPDRSRHQMVADILRFLTERGSETVVDGVLEMASESHGFLRWPRFNFRPGPEDIYVPPGVVRRYGLQSGHRIEGRLRGARDREKFLALDQVYSIEGAPAESWTVAEAVRLADGDVSRPADHPREPDDALGPLAGRWI